MSQSCAATNGKRVLVVESDMETREFVSILLYLVGYDVDQACDGDAALKALWRRGYDLIIMADKRPCINGPNLLAVSRIVSPNIPTVMISEEPPDSAESAIRRGVYAWICKPFDCVHFLRIARSAIGSAHDMSSASYLQEPDAVDIRASTDGERRIDRTARCGYAATFPRGDA